MKQYSKRAKNPDTPEVTSKYYLSNSVLLPAVLEAKAKGRVTDKLAQMLMMLARKYAQRPCFSNYTYKDDMVSEALANLCQNALKFNPEKSNNPFAYYTSCINSSFLQFLNMEKKHRKIRDQLLVDIGENPSFNFMEEHRAQTREGGEYRNELSELKTQIEEAKIRQKQDAERDAQIAQEKLAAAASLLEFDNHNIEEVTDELPTELLSFEEVQEDPTR